MPPNVIVEGDHEGDVKPIGASMPTLVSTSHLPAAAAAAAAAIINGVIGLAVMPPVQDGGEEKIPGRVVYLQVSNLLL